MAVDQGKGGLVSPTNLAVTARYRDYELDGVALSIHQEGIVCLFDGPSGRAGQAPAIGELVTLRLRPHSNTGGTTLRATAAQRTDLVTGMCTIGFELVGDLLSESDVVALTERRADPRVRPAPGELVAVRIAVAGGQNVAGMLRDLSVRGFAFDAPTSTEKVLADHAAMVVGIVLPDGPAEGLDAVIVNRRISGRDTITYGCRFVVDDNRRGLPHLLVNYVLRRRREM